MVGDDDGVAGECQLEGSAGNGAAHRGDGSGRQPFQSQEETMDDPHHLFDIGGLVHAANGLEVGSGGGKAFSGSPLVGLSLIVMGLLDWLWIRATHKRGDDLQEASA